MPEPIKDLIAASGLAIREIASRAEISPTTVVTASRDDVWPIQRRPRLALARVLGVDGDPIAMGGDADRAVVAHSADHSAPGAA